MTKREHFATSIALLASTFNRTLPAAGIEGYWLTLQGLGEDELANATKRALAECRFMPAPAELLALAARGRSLTADMAVAWQAVRRAINVHDYTDSVDFGPLVNAVVRNLGGWLRLCALGREDLDVWARKEFERIYTAFVEKDPATLNGDPHMGEFKTPPVPIAIGGVLPPQQIEPPGNNGVRQLIGQLAREKSA